MLSYLKDITSKCSYSANAVHQHACKFLRWSDIVFLSR